MDDAKRGRGRPKKPEFEDLKRLDSDFMDNADNKSDQELRDLIAKVAMNEDENRKNMREDQDLKEKKEAVKEASQQYREGTKANTLRIRYCKQLLEGRGKA